MHQLISDVDWESILNPLDLKDAWHYFSTVFDNIIAKSIYTSGPTTSQAVKNIYMSHKALCLNANFGINTLLLDLYLSITRTVKLGMSYEI